MPYIHSQNYQKLGKFIKQTHKSGKQLKVHSKQAITQSRICTLKTLKLYGIFEKKYRRITMEAGVKGKGSLKHNLPRRVLVCEQWLIVCC